MLLWFKNGNKQGEGREEQKEEDLRKEEWSVEHCGHGQLFESKARCELKF